MCTGPTKTTQRQVSQLAGGTPSLLTRTAARAVCVHDARRARPEGRRVAVGPAVTLDGGRVEEQVLLLVTLETQHVN